MNKTHRIKVLGLLGLPLLAIALAIMVFSWGSSADTTEANEGPAAMVMDVTSGTVPCPETKVEGETCVGLKAKFDVAVIVTGFPAGGYIGAQAWITFGNTGLTCQTVTMVWPDGVTEVPGGGGFNVNACNGGGVTGPLTAPVPSFDKEAIFVMNFACPDQQTASQHKLILEPLGGPKAASGGSGFSDGAQEFPATGPNLFVNCVPGPTATPTSTPPPIPKMQKCDQADNDGDGNKDAEGCSSLLNVFMTRQGAKIPPSDCLAGKGTTANFGDLAEKLSQGIVSPDPKNPSNFQQLAAFEFEVHYDNTKVCVDLNVGAAFVAAGAVCITQDDQPDSKPQLEGVARIGCLTIGKGHGIDDLVPLAEVGIYPQPEIYSQAKPNQDNGVVVQINNVGCDLSDEQGDAIPLFSCDDADITFRYLEGDVEPDCVIDAVDAQVIAFRWGAEKGSLIYRDWMNLEPSGTQADGDIDINDLQFVFGRFGSTCKDPHPDQPPVNPKA